MAARLSMTATSRMYSGGSETNKAWPIEKAASEAMIRPIPAHEELVFRGRCQSKGGDGLNRMMALWQTR